MCAPSNAASFWNVNHPLPNPMKDTPSGISQSVAELASLLGAMTCHDLAPLLERGIPRWPTHPHLVIDPTVTHEHDGYYCQSISMAEHTGCHVDAPSHTNAHLMDATIEKAPVDHLVRPASVYDFSEREWQAGDQLTAEEIIQYESTHHNAVGSGDVALINFGWLARHWRTDGQAQWFAKNQPGITDEGVALLHERGVHALGTDTMACETAVRDGKVLNGAPGHLKYLLPNHILLIECLNNLNQLTPRCFFICLPLPIKNGSGSPVRPIAFCPRTA